MVSAGREILAPISIPVLSTNVTSAVSGYTATVNNDSQDHEANAGDDFHCAEHKFNLARLATDPDCPWMMLQSPLHSLGHQSTG